MCHACGEGNERWSAERTLCHYKDLVFAIAHRFRRTYRIPREEFEDFTQELFAKLILIPQNYLVNPSGVAWWIKNKAANYIRDRKADRRDTAFVEKCVVSIDAPAKDEKKVHVPVQLKHDTSEEVHSRIDAERVALFLQDLPGPERVCISLFYGIGHARPISINMICRKLGAQPEYVKRRLARAELLLKRRIGLGSLPPRTQNAAISANG